jgi:hypothetical protein
MKKKFLIKICMIFLCMGAIINTAEAQNDGDPAVTSLSFAQSPIVVNQMTTLTLFITNGGFTTSVPAGSIGVDIILPAAGQYAAFPESLAALSGDYLSKFNWAYNSGTKTFSGVSNQDILPGDGGNIVINIRGYVVSGSTNSTANMVLLNPPAYPNDNSTNNSLVASLGVTSGVVAMNLLSFNAVKQNNTVGLKWETSSGMNSNYFDVERSTNGTTWGSIGTVQAGSSSASQQYTFTDATPVKGINYYRIKQVSVTGQVEYSLIRIVNFNTKDLITILPNPTKDRVYISTSGADPIRSVQVYSNEGKLLQTVPNFVSGSSIDIQNYAPGIYLLKIIYKNEKVQVEKIIKQ